MSSGRNNSYEYKSELSPDIAIPRIVRFWIIIPFYIPSIICLLFVLYHFITNRNLRRTVHNHSITLLLFINLITQLTNIPWVLSYYYLGYVWPQTPLFCLTWTFFKEILYITTTLLFAWATIERHILIFHDQLLPTKKKLISCHFLPIALILVYCLCYSAIVILFPPCDNTYDYTQLLCGESFCYYDRYFVAMWDVIVNDLAPTIIIIVFSIGLLIRVIYQKHRIRQRIRWRKHRKMTIQLLSISVLYLVMYTPRLTIELIHSCGISKEIGRDFMMYADFFGYYGNFLLPFVCAASIPDFKSKFKKIFRCCPRQTQVVVPVQSMPIRVIWSRPANINIYT